MQLSYGQQRLWFLHELHGASREYHIPEAFRLRGELDRAALRRAIETIVGRHESLRTRFPANGSEPVPMVDPPTSIEVPIEDLRPLPEPKREDQVTGALREEWERLFDLAGGPLLRVRLLRLADSDHVLLLTIHHIVSDGWSQGTLLGELQTLYDAFRAGRENPLRPLPIQYADFAAWQRSRVDGGAVDDDLAYWKEHLAGLPETLELPADRPRRVVETAPGSVYRVVVDGALLARLRVVGRASGATLYMTMLAAFAVLLSRYSGQHDVAVGSPIANRNRVELEQLIGFFVNTLVMRISVRPDMRFQDLLEDVRRTALRAYQHQDAPFDRVVEELSPERRLDRTPLIQVMFALNAMPATPLRLAGLEVEPVEPAEIRARFDLELHAGESPAEMTLRWVYDENLFDRWRIEQMARHYIRLLVQVSADPARPIADLELLDEQERKWLSERHGGTGGNPPDDNVCGLFAEQAKRRPEAIAVRHKGREHTYAEVDGHARRIARHLTTLGAAAGNRVGVAMEPGLILVATILGTLRCGATVVPLSPDDPVKRNAFILRDADIDLVLTHSAVADQLPDTGSMTIHVDSAWEGVGHGPVQVPVAPASAAYVAYVSGSAGHPDGIEVTHAGLGHALRWLRDQFRLGPRDRVLQRMPIGSGASVVEILATLAAGAELVVAGSADAQNVEYLVDTIRRAEITFVQLPPSLLRTVAKQRGLKGCVSLRCVISGGEILPPALCHAFRSAVGAQLWNTYGATETTAQCTFHDSSLDGEHHHVPIGRPIADTYTLVLDERMRLVPKGVLGELHVGGPGLARGYLDRAKLTADRFVADPYHPGQRLWGTGDLVRWTADGELEYFGRTDDQVKVDGHRIEPGEIEAALRRHTKVVQAVAVAHEDEPGERRIAAYIVLSKASVVTSDDLRAHLRTWLPPYLIPAEIVPMDELPRTPHGAVDRQALRALSSPRSENETDPRTPTENLLHPIFAEVLGLEQVGGHDNFFVLGGHSLMAMRLIARVYETTGVELAVRDVFEAPTVAELATTVEARRP